MKLPVQCPSCDERLQVSKLSCSSCGTEVVGKYGLPLFLQLSTEEQEFVFQFLMNSGSLKEMSIQLGKSYPTVRNKLDDLITKINVLKDGK